MEICKRNRIQDEETMKQREGKKGGGNSGEQGEGESGKPDLSEGQKQEQEL